MSMLTKIAPLALLALLAAPLGACQTVGVPNAPVNVAVAPPPLMEGTSSAYVQPTAPPDPMPIENRDDLALGKQYFAANDYGLAEQHFRRAVEAATGPRERDIEAWLGLAASYDHLRRFELADRAYAQAMRAMGPTPELLNNQGYSYIMRRDFRRARTTLTRALKKDPGNPYIENNIALLAQSEGSVSRLR